MARQYTIRSKEEKLSIVKQVLTATLHTYLDTKDDVVINRKATFQLQNNQARQPVTPADANEMK